MLIINLAVFWLLAKVFIDSINYPIHHFEFEIQFKNKLTQKVITRECSEWI